MSTTHSLLFDFVHGFTMPAITTSEDGEFLVVEFVDNKLLDTQRIEEVGYELSQAVPRATNGKLLLNFTGVSFMSSAMINKLVMLNKECKQQDVILKFSHVMPNVMEVFRIARLFRDNFTEPQSPPVSDE